MRAAYRSNDALRRWAVTGLCCAVSVTGCVFGPSPRGLVRRVHGATARIEARQGDGARGTVTGELLAVTDSGVLMLGEEGQVLAVPHARILRLRVRQPSTNVTGARLVRSPEVRDEVRQLSRYPYGVRPATLDSLVAAAGQAAVLVPGAPTTPPGIEARLRALTRQGIEISLDGELVAVEDSALVVASDERGIVRVAYACLTRAAFEGVETPPGLGERRVPSAADRAALARRARFPEGLGPNELERVLPAGSRGPIEVRCN